MSESPKGRGEQELPRMPVRSRFGYYFVGLSIGCIMSWAIVSARSKAVAKEREREAAAQQEEDRTAHPDEPNTPD